MTKRDESAAAALRALREAEATHDTEEDAMRRAIMAFLAAEASRPDVSVATARDYLIPRAYEVGEAR